MATTKKTPKRKAAKPAKKVTKKQATKCAVVVKAYAVQEGTKAAKKGKAAVKKNVKKFRKWLNEVKKK